MGSGRKYRKLGDKASEQFLENGQPLNESIQKLANQENLNEHEVQRVVEHANVNSFLSQFKEAEDKTEVIFDVANPDAIDVPAESPGKEASVTDLTDYETPPARTNDADQVKQAEDRLLRAQSSQDRERTKEEWVDHLKSAGVSPDVIERFVNDWDQQIRCDRSRDEAEKVAMRHLPTFALDEPQQQEKSASEGFSFGQQWANDYFSDKDLDDRRSRLRARSKLASARDAIEDSLKDLEVHGESKVADLKDEIVETMKQGYRLTTIKEAVQQLNVDSEADEFVKFAFGEASERQTDMKLNRSERDLSPTKTASLNDDHPIVSAVSEIDNWVDRTRKKQAELKRVQSAIETIDAYESD